MSIGDSKWKVAAVWACRILAGATFVISGWAKAVDPRGFAFKIDEYLSVWNMADILPEGLTGLIACIIAIFELTLGIALLTGSLRRSSAICALFTMCFWLPLTVYISIADPVADCGCFGDFIILSNTATLLKNIALTAILIICLVWYKCARPLYRAGLQWLVIVLSVLYGLVIAVIGWHIQPTVDFRPFPVGSGLVSGQPEDTTLYIYEKDGEEKEFPLNELPDSTWTFVKVENASSPRHTNALAVFDGDDEVTEELFGDKVHGRMIIMVYAEPGIDNLMRSRMANEIYDYARNHNIEMIGLVAASDDTLEQWKKLTNVNFDVYSADDTSLKQLVRGPIGIVLLEDGKIVWKRNFLTLPADLLTSETPLESVWVVDDGRVAAWLAVFFIGGLLLLLGISKLTTINIKPPKSITKFTGTPDNNDSKDKS